MSESDTKYLPQNKYAKWIGVTDRTIRNWEKAGLIKGDRVRGVKLYPVVSPAEMNNGKEAVSGNAQ